ncbi:DUF4157 domain-containing protein [Sorangium sp. So ce429]
MQIAIDRSTPKASRSAARTSRARPPAPLLVRTRTMTSARPPADPARAALERAFGAEFFAGAATRPGVGAGSGPGRGGNLTGIPSPVRAKMEAAFGADFSGVRVHPNSSRAVELRALAYTQGSEIHVAPGQWAPETRLGQELLGHELAHVVQQREGRVQATAQYKGAALNDDARLEAEADAMGARAAQGASAAPPARTGTPSPAGGQVSQASSQTPCGPVLQCGRPKRSSTRNTGSALRRTPFWTSTLKGIPLKSGEHRRHIIPSSLFIGAINAWQNHWAADPSQTEIYDFKTKYRTGQDLYERLNNHQPNLIAGSGPENSAIGMYMHSSEKAINAARAQSTDTAAMTSLTTAMSKYSGFQQGTQRTLIDPVVAVVGSTGSFAEGARIATDLHDNAAFDWPYGGAKNIEQWEESYMQFVNIKDRPGEYEFSDFDHYIGEFMKLPRP